MGWIHAGSGRGAPHAESTEDKARRLAHEERMAERDARPAAQVAAEEAAEEAIRTKVALDAYCAECGNRYPPERAGGECDYCGRIIDPPRAVEHCAE